MLSYYIDYHNQTGFVHAWFNYLFIGNGLQGQYHLRSRCNATLSSCAPSSPGGEHRVLTNLTRRCSSAQPQCLPCMQGHRAADYLLSVGVDAVSVAGGTSARREPPYEAASDAAVDARCVEWQLLQMLSNVDATKRSSPMDIDRSTLVCIHTYIYKYEP